MKVPDGEWRLVCSADVFSGLRADKEFAFLVTLARIVNAFKFGVAAMVKETSATPASDRQRMQAFLYVAALVHEMLDFRSRHGREWSGLTAYQQTFGTLTEKAVDGKTAELLRQIRNRAAFHFDPSVAAKTLPTFPEEGFSFLAGASRLRMDANFELADMVTFAFLFGVRDVESAFARFSEFYATLQRLGDDIVARMESVLIERLRARGFRVEELPPGTYARSTTPDPVVSEPAPPEP